MIYFYGYLALINLTALVLCAKDKYAAIRGKWRVPERTLLLFSAFGGAWGMGLGMILFRHKIRHRRFTVNVPLLSLLWLAAAIYLATGVISK
jgi:uncharacterized membrane protein YsdA (DUF1294 family)